jgi:hypothetical protein
MSLLRGATDNVQIAQSARLHEVVKGMDTKTDSATDSSDGSRWLTYGELAEIRGIDKRSVVKLAGRHRWRRQKDNQGYTRVLVPNEWATAKADASSDMSSWAAEVTAHIIAAMREDMDRMAESAERRADALGDQVRTMEQAWREAAAGHGGAGNRGRA